MKLPAWAAIAMAIGIGVGKRASARGEGFQNHQTPIQRSTRSSHLTRSWRRLASTSDSRRARLGSGVELGLSGCSAI